MVTLEKLKRYLNIDSNIDDLLLADLIIAATMEVTAKTKMENDTDSDPRYDLACYKLIASWYLYRESEIAGTTNKALHGYDMLITSLRKGRSFV